MWVVVVHKSYVYGKYWCRECTSSKKWVFNKNKSVMAWQKLQVRGTNSRYAYVDKFRVITDAL
jgi:hypothetical protein